MTINDDNNVNKVTIRLIKIGRTFKNFDQTDIHDLIFKILSLLYLRTVVSVNALNNMQAAAKQQQQNLSHFKS